MFALVKRDARPPHSSQARWVATSQMQRRIAPNKVVEGASHQNARFELDHLDRGTRVVADWGRTCLFSDGTDTAPSSFHADVITDFSHAQGELRYRLEASTGDTIVEMDLNGDGVRDMSIRLTGTQDLVAGDFLL
jgi:hypothetical protein